MATTTMANPKRLYQVWKGSNIFACGGRLIFGPDVNSLYLSVLLIAGPSIAFCSQVIAKIHKHQHSDISEGANGQSHILGFPVLFVAILITIADLTFLFLTSSRDPGILPRNSRSPESDEQFNATTPSMEWVYGRTPHLRLPRTKDVLVNGFIVKVKYCDTCLLYRPPRASHCSICNNCVQKFDHHCPWVGQCIGLRNYRFFFLFISSSTFLCIYIFVFSLLNILEEKKNYDNSILRSMRGQVLSVILLVYTFFSVWFVGGLTVFHLYLISTNQTTYENFRYRYDKKENPYNVGIAKNFKDVFFSKIPPSMNDFQSWVVDDMMEVGSTTPSTRMDIINPKDQIDLEMSTKSELGGNASIPSILQNLDYSAIENNLQGKDRHNNDASGHFTFPTIHEPIAQGLGNSDHNSLGIDGMDAVERTSDGSRSSDSSDHAYLDVHVQ